MRMIRGVSYFSVALLVFLGSRGRAQESGSLTPGATYTIRGYQVLSSGSLSEFASTTAQAGSDGTLIFTLNSAPTNSQCNFLATKVFNSDGNLVRTSFAAAVPAGATTQVGCNTLTGKQANAYLAAIQAAGSGDPALVLFIGVILRTSNLSDTVVSALATLCNNAIVASSSGFRGFCLNSGGVSSAQYATFLQNLVYNTNDQKDLGDYFALFRESVLASTESASNQSQGEAGGLAGEICCEAAMAAGIPIPVIEMAFESAGTVASTDPNFGSIPTTAMISINSSMASFRQRVSTIRVKTEYAHAMTTLGVASGSSWVSRFNTAVDVLTTNLRLLDRAYASYHLDPTTMTNTIATTIQTQGVTYYSTFETSIRGTVEDATTLRALAVTTLGISESLLTSMSPPFCREYGRSFGGDFNGPPLLFYWTLPKIVLTQWYLNKIVAGGVFSYTRSTDPIPTGASWLSGRNNFGALGALQSLFQAWEDIHIAQFGLFQVFVDNGGGANLTQESAARMNLKDKLSAIANNISVSGIAPLTNEEKNAIILCSLAPEIN